MKVELEKREEINGKIWWAIRIDGEILIPAYYQESEARAMYEFIIGRARLRNYPIVETVGLFDANPKQE